VGISLKRRFPRWKIWASFITEITLERTYDRNDKILTVCLSRGRVQLYTENAIYSWEDRYTQFREVFYHLAPTLKGKKEVLLLGLGLGSIPFILEKKLGLFANYTAVECDEQIIYLAEKYLLKYLDSPMCTMHADALAFPTYTKERYDIICVDVFEDQVTPLAFFSKKYLENLRKCMGSGGLLLFNILRTQRPPVETIAAVFPGAYPFRSGENDVWVAWKNNSRIG